MTFPNLRADLSWKLPWRAPRGETGRVFVCSIPNLLFDFQKSLCSGSFVSFEPNLLFDFQNGARPVEGGVGRAEVLSFVFVIFQDLYIQNITKCHTLVAF